MSALIRIAAASSTLLLCACAAAPSSSGGSFAQIGQTEASNPATFGQEVRWGGVVVGARSSGSGTCTEVAAFPLDRYYARPYFRDPTPAGHQILFGNDPRLNDRAPHFLACGNDGSTAQGVGAVVTLTGIIRTAQTFNVVAAACDDRLWNWHTSASLPRYQNTLHASANGTCVVSLPTIQLTSTHAWKEPAFTGIESVRSHSG